MRISIGNLNAPDEPIPTKIEGRFRIYTPMPSQSWLGYYIYSYFLIGEENEVQKIPLHSKESLPVKKPQPEKPQETTIRFSPQDV